MLEILVFLFTCNLYFIYSLLLFSGVILPLKMLGFELLIYAYENLSASGACFLLNLC